MTHGVHERPVMFRTLISTLSGLREAMLKIEWLGPLVMRLGFGYFWLETGWYKLVYIENFTMRFASWGIPWPGLSAMVSAGTDMLGGALLMLGLATRLACVPMIINMVVALVLVVSRDISGLDEYVESSELTYILILFWLLMAGPGRASLDAWLWRKLRNDQPAGNA